MTQKALSIEVRGMGCEGCVNKVTNALQSIKGVNSVEVSLEKERANVRFEAEKVDEAKIRKAITRAGFLAGDVSLVA